MAQNHNSTLLTTKALFLYIFSYLRYVGALIHIVKGSLGIGILSVPRAFKTAGLLMGTLGTIFVGILCTYTIHLLVSIYFYFTESSN